MGLLPQRDGVSFSLNFLLSEQEVSLRISLMSRKMGHSMQDIGMYYSLPAHAAGSYYLTMPWRGFGSICAATCIADLANCRAMFHMPRVKEYAEVGQGSWHYRGEF